MARTNYFKLVEQIYRIKPTISDFWLTESLVGLFGYAPKVGTISVWKSKLREKGVPIPYRMKGKRNDN